MKSFSIRACCFRGQYIRALWLALATAMLFAILIVQTASAHAILVKSDPADHATLAQPPAQVRFWFSEEVDLNLSSLHLLDEYGQEISPVLLQGDPSQPALVIANLPKIGTGVYTLAYSVISKQDGHNTTGSIVFGVNRPVTVGSTPAGKKAIRETTLISGIILRWLIYVAFACLAGGFIVSLLVLSPSILVHHEAPAFDKFLFYARRRVLAWSVVLGAITLLLNSVFYVWQVREILNFMPDGTSFFGVSHSLLHYSRLGSLWVCRQVLVIFILTLASIARYIDQQGSQLHPGVEPFHTPQSKRVRMLLVLESFLAAALMVVQSLTSHAYTVTPYPALAVALDSAHLLAVGVWLGGLLSLQIALGSFMRQPDDDDVQLARIAWSPFSILAAFSVGVLFATGLYATGAQVASLDAMLTTSYGRLLIVKHLLFLIVGSLGLINSMILHPDIFAPVIRLMRRLAGWITFPSGGRSVLTRVEAGLGAVVLLIVGYLVANPTANSPEYQFAGRQQPNPMTQTVGDLSVIFSVQPNLPGVNTFTIHVAGPQESQSIDIARVILHFKYLGTDMKMGELSVDAARTEPGAYQLQGDQLSMVGPWSVDVVLRSLGIQDRIAHYNWVILPTTQRQVVSNKDWQPELESVGVVMLAAILLGAVMALLKSRR